MPLWGGLWGDIWGGDTLSGIVLANLMINQAVYTSVAEARREGLPTTISDDNAFLAIVEAGEMIDSITSQYFTPRFRKYLFRSDGNHIQYYPESVPLLGLDLVTINDTDILFTGTLDEDDEYFELLRKRYIEFTGFSNLLRRSSLSSYGSSGQGAFPSGPPPYGSKIGADGWFGWVEDFHGTAPRIETTLDGAVNDGAVSAVLDDISGINVGDTVILGADQTTKVAVFVDQVDTSAKKITFFKLSLPAPIPDAAAVFRFGRVPVNRMSVSFIVTRSSPRRGTLSG